MCVCNKGMYLFNKKYVYVIYLWINNTHGYIYGKYMEARSEVGSNLQSWHENHSFPWMHSWQLNWLILPKYSSYVYDKR